MSLMMRPGAIWRAEEEGDFFQRSLNQSDTVLGQTSGLEFGIGPRAEDIFTQRERIRNGISVCTEFLAIYEP